MVCMTLHVFLYIKRSTPTTQVLIYTPTTAGSTVTPSRATTSTMSDTSSSTASDTPGSSPKHVDTKPEGG